MSPLRVPAGAYLLGPQEVELVRRAIASAQRYRQSVGLSPLRAFADLAVSLAADGQTDSTAEPMWDAEVMDTNELARALGCSARTARRVAQGLDGRKVGGVWVVDRLAALEHINGREES